MTISSVTAAALPLTPGNVGEQIVGSVVRASAVSLTSTTAANVTSVTLTAGLWMIQGSVTFVPAATTSITKLIVAVSATSATLPATSTSSVVNTAGEILVPTATAANVVAADTSIVVPVFFYAGAATTLYLVASSTFTVSTNTACGSLVAIRYQ